LTLQATEFIRRFLLHVLPRGFVKIRHFGFLANRGREDNLRLCRALLDAQSPNVRDAVTRQPQPNPPDRCPLCNEGSMRPVEILLPQAAALARSLGDDHRRTKPSLVLRSKNPTVMTTSANRSATPTCADLP
jgi:Putative transposase